MLEHDERSLTNCDFQEAIARKMVRDGLSVFDVAEAARVHVEDVRSALVGRRRLIARPDMMRLHLWLEQASLHGNAGTVAVAG